MTETRAAHGTVVLTVADGLAHVELDRAETLNSLTGEVMADLVEIGRSLIERHDVGAVVLSGRGRAFCAGLDVSEFGRMVSGGGGSPESAQLPASQEPLGAARAVAQQCVHVWSLVPAPVIAAVQAVAYGGGLQIALGADVRIASRELKASMMEVNWGIIPDMCGTQLLTRLVGPGRAKLTILTGRVIDAETALAWGMVDELADDANATALALGRELAEKSRPALREAKKLVDLAATADLAEGFAAEQKAIRSLIGGPEQQEAVAKRMTELRARKG